MNQRILITGGAGFIGHHMVEHFLKNTAYDIVVLDRLNYASGGLDRLRDINVFDGKRVLVLTADFTKPIVEGLAREIGNVDYIIHMGAETHVDRSIENPRAFVYANVVGTLEMLEFARTQPSLKKFVYFSTDEVFGPAPKNIRYKEWDRYNSTNPYSATKAGGEELALAYANTYRLPIIVTHTMNVFGERQHPEKFIPKAINLIRKGRTVPIHANAIKTKPGSRFWIHARNVAHAIDFLLTRDTFREKYNIVGEREINNRELAASIARVLKKPLRYKLIDFHSSRPGHDLRYALDGAKMTALGWRIPMSFENSLGKTILWSLAHPRWLLMDTSSFSYDMSI